MVKTKEKGKKGQPMISKRYTENYRLSNRRTCIPEGLAVPDSLIIVLWFYLATTNCIIFKSNI